MQHTLMQPETQAALRALAARRRRVLIVRGLFAFVLTLLAAMAAVAMVDRLVVMSDTLRIVLSLAAYLVVVAVLWATSLRFLLRWPTQAELARLIEQASPELREDLVSAVELSGDGNEMDSQAFREVLQRNVGKRVAKVDPQAILPWKIIAWWAGVSTGAVVLTVVLLLTPGLRYGEMLTRAMLPMADRDRVSTTRITLLSPSPDGSGKVPMHERVPVRVHVEGGSFDKVEMDVDRGDAGRETLRFAATSKDNEYLIDLPIADRPLRFRVAAGDGLTRYFDLDPTARPDITRATLTTTPPAYTGFEPTRATGDLGPIAALAGSLVDLVLTADQPINKAELRLEIEGEQSTIPLVVDPADPTRLRASVPIEKSGDYRVYLKAADTGFDTPDSQRYELTAVTDELPQVTLREPTGQAGSARDALIRLLGSASDDVALAVVQQQTRVNGGDWQSRDLETSPRGQIADAIDLMGMKLKVGDEVELRLAAIDKADNTAYSESARLIVTPDGLRRVDAQALQSQQALLTTIEQTRDATERFAEAVKEFEQVSNRSATATARQQSLARVRSARIALSDTTSLLQDRSAAALDRAVHGREADHLVRIGRLLATPQTLSITIESLSTDDDAIKAVAELARHDNRDYDQAEHLLRTMLAISLTESAELQLASVHEAIGYARRQLKIDQDIDPELADQRLQRRLLGIVAQAEQAHQSLAAAETVSKDGGVTRDAGNASQTLGTAIEQVNTVVNPLGNDRGTLVRLVDQLEQAVQRSHDQAFAANVNALRDARQLYDRERYVLPDESQSIRRIKDRLTNDDAPWQATLEELLAHARVEERSPDADRAFLKDLSQAHAALTEHRRALEQGVASDQVKPQLQVLTDAQRKLELVHDLRVLRAMAVALQRSEAQREENPLAAFRHRGDWNAIDTRFPRLAEQLQREQALREAGRIVQQIQNQGYYRAADTEFDRRRNKQHRLQNREDELTRIVQELGKALAEAAVVEREAREEVAEQTPTLPERMRDLAEQADKLSEESRQAADKAEQEPSAESKQDAAALAQKQEQLGEQLNQLSEQIRRQADEEDLLTEQGRERSRDADDAIAMLKPDAEEAERQLAEAQTLERPDLQAKAIDQAADAQERSAETLRDLAEHFENLENKDPAAEQTRQALRDAEQDLGLKEQLDAEYEKMERLAELAQADDAERLAQLEEMLEQEPAMRRELDRIAEGLAEDAQQQVAEAAAQERQVAEDLQERSERAERDQQRQEQALQQLAERAVEVERDQVRQLEDKTANNVPQAKQDIEQARDALRQASAQARPDAQQQREQGESAEQEQRIAEFAEQAREAADAVDQASKESAEERDEQKEQARDARRRADRGIREGQPDAEAAREVIESNRAAENAEQVRQAADRASRDVDRLADQAEKLAEQSERQGEQRARDLGQAAQKQEQLAEQTRESAEDLARAARHQERLGDQQRAEQLQDQAEGVGEVAEQTLPQTEQKIANAGEHKPAAEAAQQAADQLQQQADQLAGDNPGAGEPNPGEPQSAEGNPPGQSNEQQPAGQSEPSQGEPSSSDPSSPDPSSSDPGQPQQGEPSQNQLPPNQGEGQSQGQSQAQSQSQSQSQGSDPSQQSPSQPQREAERLGERADQAAPLDAEIAEQLAQELDRLDAQQAAAGQLPGDASDAPPQSADNGDAPPAQGEPSEGQSAASPPGQGTPDAQSNSPANPLGQRPIDQAAQQQAQNIRDARNPAKQPAGPNAPAQPGQGPPPPGLAKAPSQPNGSGSPENNGAELGPPAEAGELADAPTGKGDWGNLPERIAEDLNQGARERAPAEYLDQVDAYFKAIAQRAQNADDE